MTGQGGKYRVVISGYYGFGNAGDEAMLAAMLEALSGMEPEISYTVISGSPEDTVRRHGVAAIHRLNFPAIVSAVSRCDLLISGGGSLLQDVTSDRSVYYYLGIILLAKKLGKPVMLYGQGIGPLRRPMARKAARLIVDRADMITVRDEGSRRELASLEVTRPPILVTADPVLAINPVGREIGRLVLRRAGVEGASPLIGFSVRECPDWEPCQAELAAAAEKLAAEFGARLVFLPMQWPDDVAAAAKVIARLRCPVTAIQENYGIPELMSIVGNLDLLVGIRLHALIFAAVMRVPLVGISYDPKIDGFLASLGEVGAGTIDTVKAEDILARARAVWAFRHAGAPGTAHRLADLRRKALQNAELAVEILETSRQARQ